MCSQKVRPTLLHHVLTRSLLRQVQQQQHPSMCAVHVAHRAFIWRFQYVPILGRSQHPVHNPLRVQPARSPASAVTWHGPRTVSILCCALTHGPPQAQGRRPRFWGRMRWSWRPCTTSCASSASFMSGWRRPQRLVRWLAAREHPAHAAIYRLYQQAGCPGVLPVPLCCISGYRIGGGHSRLWYPACHASPPAAKQALDILKGHDEGFGPATAIAATRYAATLLATGSPQEAQVGEASMAGSVRRPACCCCRAQALLALGGPQEACLGWSSRPSSCKT